MAFNVEQRLEISVLELWDTEVSKWIKMKKYKIACQVILWMTRDVFWRREEERPRKTFIMF